MSYKQKTKNPKGGIAMGIFGLTQEQIEKAMKIAEEENCRSWINKEGEFIFLGKRDCETRVSRRIQEEILNGVVTM